MPPRVRAKIEGGQKIAQRLRILPQEVAHQHLKGSAEAAGEVIRSAMARRSPRGAGGRQIKGKAIGHLADSIKSVVSKERGGKLEIAIGPDSQHFYALMVEFGHRLVRVTNRIKVKGRVRRVTKDMGSVPPHPFARPAFDESQAGAQQEFSDQIRRRLRL